LSSTHGAAGGGWFAKVSEKCASAGGVGWEGGGGWDEWGRGGGGRGFLGLGLNGQGFGRYLL